MGTLFLFSRRVLFFLYKSYTYILDTLYIHTIYAYNGMKFIVEVKVDVDGIYSRGS